MKSMDFSSYFVRIMLHIQYAAGAASPRAPLKVHRCDSARIQNASAQEKMTSVLACEIKDELQREEHRGDVKRCFDDNVNLRSSL